MTEFEMAYLFNDMWIQLIMQAQYFFAMLTAFLVASYLAAHTLTRSMMAVVVGLFLVVGLAAVQNIYRQSQSIIGLAFEMKAAAASGKGLAWHGATKVPEWALTAGGIPGVVIGLSAIAAAVYFFFHCRRANRKAEDGAAQPKA